MRSISNNFDSLMYSYIKIKSLNNKTERNNNIELNKNRKLMIEQIKDLDF